MSPNQLTPSLAPERPLEQRGGSQLLGVGTALPSYCMSQEESLAYALTHFPMKEGTKALYKRVFRNPSVKKRAFAFQDPSEVLEKDLDLVQARFESRATELSVRSLEQALTATSTEAKDIDFLAVTTCTGYLCPGLSAHVADKLKLRTDVSRLDAVGMGCGAALPALEAAHHFLSAHPSGLAAVVCTEICSSAICPGEEVDLVISNALFGDGSAAILLKGTGDFSKEGPLSATPGVRISAFTNLLVPAWKDTLRFRTREGKLMNVLGKEVPAQAAEALAQVVDKLLAKEGLSRKDISRWILHAGGGKVLDALREKLALTEETLAFSREVLQECGNLSSPTVLFVLARELAARPPRKGERGILASFGAGFSAHAALLTF